ncbi:MAG: glycerol-3-phosphate 1-O-acyltransferase PlsY [Alphaproteobacteria bacterium]|nr:glycerol-3-phosphate 1-O-acyltransferase PlsY [Alphaproteobacteria bacterium]
MQPAIGYIVALVVGYLLGSIPFGLVFTRLAGMQDIRAIGSGSIGATNVLRTGRIGLAAATLIADVLKGTAAVLLVTRWSGHDAGLVAGLGAFLGHLFPLWLKFKGGKGIATGLGILLAVSWQAALVIAVIWLSVAAATRYSSLASLVASVAAPIAIWFLGTPSEALLFLALAILAFIMHRGNIARLIGGTESKIGQKSTGTSASA